MILYKDFYLWVLSLELYDTDLEFHKRNKKYIEFGMK